MSPVTASYRHEDVPAVHFLADRTNGHTIGTVLCLSVCRHLSVVFNVMYCV